MREVLVTIAARNAERTIGAAIRSALAGPPVDLRVMVWDDASEDDTARAAAAVRDPRVGIIRSPHPVGSGMARQRLIESEQTRVVANLDADDLWFPGHLSRSLRRLDSADATFAAAVRFGPEHWRVRPTRLAAIHPDETPTVLLIHNPLVHSTFVARREAIDQVGGYHDLHRGQDYHLWLRMATSLRLSRASGVEVGYRQSASQVSRAEGYQSALDGDARLRLARLDLERELGLIGDDPAMTLRAAVERMTARNRRYYRRLIARESMSRPGRV